MSKADEKCAGMLRILGHLLELLEGPIQSEETKIKVNT